MIIDTIRPPGAWEREWDKRTHTETELRREIHDLRQRITEYISEIESLTAQLDDERDLMLTVRDGLRRLDPSWCWVNDKQQISDEDLDYLIGEVEELCDEIIADRKQLNQPRGDEDGTENDAADRN